MFTIFVQTEDSKKLIKHRNCLLCGHSHIAIKYQVEVILDKMILQSASLKAGDRLLGGAIERKGDILGQNQFP